MGTVNVTLGDGKKLNLPLGRQGENEVTAVVFDFSAWSTEFGSGTLSLSVQRHGDELPYAVTMTTSGTNATWTISDLDTAYKGTGEAQVKYTVGTKVKKSAVYKFTVNKSLGQNGEYPSPGQTWQEEIEDELADVKQDLSNLSLGINPEDDLIYIYLNGVPIGEGVEGGGTGVRYTVGWNLTNVTSSSHVASVSEGKPINATLTANEGYEINSASVVILMDGVDITVNAYSNGTIAIASVTGNVLISASASKAPIDLLNVTWANHAITCGQDTNNYNAWSPHNLQYDDINDCFVFLQCHSNRHLSGTYTNWTLSVVNPYDSNDYQDITIPTFNGLGMLFVENGVWTLMPRGGSSAYRSSDMGEAWETLSANIPTHLFGVYKCGNTYFGGNDSNNEITYYKSSDLLTWETVSFDSSLGYSVLCETTFCEYDGKWWAFNRTNDSTLGHPVILQSMDEGETWTLFSDQMLHGYRSTVSCYPFKNYIMVADIDRDNGYLYYSKFDGTTFTELNSWKVPHAGDDFHNVNIASNYEDTIVLEFMHGASGFDITYGSGAPYTAQRACDNVMLIGSTSTLPTLNLDYIDTISDMVDYLNANCVIGYNSQRTYRWSKPSYSNNLYCYYGETVTGFDDEISIPLNLVQMNAGLVSTTLKSGNKFVKAWSNETTNPSRDIDRNAVYGTQKQGFIDIGGHRYTLGVNTNSNRADALPILTRQDYIVDLPEYTKNTSDASVVGQTWQENLGFRRVVSVRNQTSGDSSDSIINSSVFSGSYEHAFAVLSYTPVT